MLDQFYTMTALESATLEDDLDDWFTDYNYRRVHRSLGDTSVQRWAEREDELPLWEDVVAAFDVKKEANFVEQLTLRHLRCGKQNKQEVRPCVQISHLK